MRSSHGLPEEMRCRGMSAIVHPCVVGVERGRKRRRGVTGGAAPTPDVSVVPTRPGTCDKLRPHGSGWSQSLVSFHSSSPSLRTLHRVLVQRATVRITFVLFLKSQRSDGVYEGVHKMN